jgi:hypothetical protein
VNDSKQSPVRGSAFFSLLAPLLCLAAPAPAAAQAGVTDNPRLCTKSALSDSVRVGKYIFRAYRSDEGACLEVVHAGDVVFRRAGDAVARYTLGQQEDPDNDIPTVPNGTDLTGHEQSDMIVSSSTGGAHCCTAHLVFELDPDFRLLATLNDSNDDLAHFARVNPEHLYFYFTADWTFAYWPSCFACSPSAPVILRFVDDAQGGAFHLALDKMRTPAPTPSQWAQDLRAAQQSASQGDIDSIGRTLWQPVLSWIYQGHSDLAWKFVEEAGPKAQQSPLPTLDDFCRLLTKSAYWPDLAPTLRDAPPACSAGAPQK